MKRLLNIDYFFSIFKRTKKSFSLIEISVALAVIGIISSGGIVAYQNSNPKLRSDVNKITKIHEAMQNFFTKNNRLPAPALLDTTDNSEGEISATKKYLSYDAEISNNILWGNVPVKALGLSSDYLYDSRGKIIEYVVHSALVEGINVDNKSYTKKGYISNNNAYNIHYENTSNEKFYYNPTGISIIDEKTNTTITPNIAYAIISKQGDDKCYNNKKISNKEIPSDDTKYNCNNFYDNSTITLHQGYSKSFDNIVSYITLDELVVSMTKVKNQLTEIRQGRGLEYQSKYDEDLITEKKDITGSINELKITKEPVLPSGTMILFYKEQSQIPEGWQVCDGTNGTPDMRGYFAMGANTDGQLTTSGGSNAIIITVPAHKHKYTCIPKHNHSHSSHSCSFVASSTYAYSFSSYLEWVKVDADRNRKAVGEPTWQQPSGSCSFSFNIDYRGEESCTTENNGSAYTTNDITNLHRKIYYICKV